MTTMDGTSIPAPVGADGLAAEAVAARPRLLLGVPAEALRQPERLVFGAPLAVSAAGLIVGIVALFQNAADVLVVPTLAVLALSLVATLAFRRRKDGSWDRTAAVLAGLSMAAIVLLLLMPEWTLGWNINGIIHRSVVSAPLLLLLSTFAASYALRGLLGATPSGQDMSLYPWLALPIILALAIYGIILGKVVISGVSGLSVDLLTTAWTQGDTATLEHTVGFLNNILGTLLLVFLTCSFALFPGVGAGVFMSENPGRIARIIDFCTTMLRAVAVFIIGAAAFGLVHIFPPELAAGTPISDLVRGSYADATGVRPERGSFLLAAFFLAMLVIPVIAKLTEQGLRSVPRDIREGTVAVGATDGYGLRRIMLPWALPSIITGLVLAAAEAAGSLAVVMFVAVPGEHGIGLTTGVTSLDYAVFATKYGPRAYVESMRDYQYTAALLLLFLTLGLTLVAMLLRRRFATRYRGSLTAA
jgi:phosphate transport system permease protein